jgi:chromosomal replication initiation ATPase DnaA
VSAADIVSAVLEYFGITRARLLDHAHRDEDVMDARAMVAYVLNTRMGYSGRRAAKALGYKESTLTHAWERLRLRMYASPRLRATVGLIFPQKKAAA